MAHARPTALACAGCLAAFSCLLPTVVHAQRDVSIERWSTPLDGDGFLGLQGTRTPGRARYSLGLFANYASSLLDVELPSGESVEVVDQRLGSELTAELGLDRRVALGASLPLVLYQSGDEVAGAQLDSFAVGDPRIVLRHRFIGRAEGNDDVQRDGPGIALQLGARLPFGQDEAYAGEGAPRIEAELIGDLHVLGAGVGGSVGMRHRFERRQLFDHSLRDEFLFGAALKLPVPPLAPLSGVLEVRGATDFRSPETTVVEGALGALWPVGDFVLSLSAGLGLTGGFGAPGVRVVGGAWYRPSPSDTDGDGIPDDEDGCPPLPEDLDGFQDEDGCPDPDNDNDLIPDADDLCPNDEALEGRDEDEDGCTDPLPVQEGSAPLSFARTPVRALSPFREPPGSRRRPPAAVSTRRGSLRSRSQRGEAQTHGRSPQPDQGKPHG